MRASQQNAYRSASTPLVKSWIVPDRPFLFMVREHWPVVRGAMISIAVISAVSSHLGWIWGLLALGAYLASYIPIRVTQWEDSQTASILELGGGMLSVAALLLWLSLSGDGGGAAESEIWLLWLIPAVGVGAQLKRYWALGFLVALSALAFFSRCLVVDFNLVPMTGEIFGEGLTRGLVVGVVGFSTYVFARALAYLEWSNRKMLEHLPEITRPNWDEATARALQTMDDLINRTAPTANMGLPLNKWTKTDNPIVVNILQKTSAGLRMIASSSPGGQNLVAEGFCVPEGSGVTNWVATHNERCYLQDSELDPEKRFYARKEFPGVRSELAVPVQVDGRVVAVVDLEAQTARAFHEELEFMAGVFSAGLAESYQQDRNQKTQRKLAELARNIALRVTDAPEELERLLGEIGKEAITFLDADVIGFYHKALVSGDFIGPFYAGDLKRREEARAPHPIDPESIVGQLIRDGGKRVFWNARVEPELRQRDAWHALSGTSPFIDREEIQTAVALPLRIGSERIGLMFVNFRRPIELSEEANSLLDLLGTLAAHAIQGWLRNSAAIETDSQRLREDLHDGLSNQLLLVHERLTAHLRERTSHRQFRAMMLDNIGAVNECIDLVAQVRRGRRPHSLTTVLNKIIEFARSQREPHSLDVDIGLDGTLDVLGSHIVYGSEEIVYAAKEAISNAVKHARAKRLAVHLYRSDNDLMIIVKDDGVGFDPKSVKGGSGLSHLDSRVRTNLGGVLEITSQTNAGTQVKMRIPLVAADAEPKTGNTASS